jgi:hypothetical protein
MATITKNRNFFKWPKLLYFKPECAQICSHLEWRAGLSETILKGTYQRTIPARFGLIWFSGFREEDLNVIVYQNMPNSFKSSSLKPLNQIKPNLAGMVRW